MLFYIFIYIQITNNTLFGLFCANKYKSLEASNNINVRDRQINKRNSLKVQSQWQAVHLRPEI